MDAGASSRASVCSIGQLAAEIVDQPRQIRLRAGNAIDITIGATTAAVAPVSASQSANRPSFAVSVMISVSVDLVGA